MVNAFIGGPLQTAYRLGQKIDITLGPMMVNAGNATTEIIPASIYPASPFGLVLDTRIDPLLPVPLKMGFALVTPKDASSGFAFSFTAMSEITDALQEVTLIPGTNEIVFVNPVQDLTTLHARLDGVGDIIQISASTVWDGIYIITGFSTTTNPNDTAQVVRLEPLGPPSFTAETVNAQILGWRVNAGAENNLPKMWLTSGDGDTNDTLLIEERGFNSAINVMTFPQSGNALRITHNGIFSPAISVECFSGVAGGMSLSGYGASGHGLYINWVGNPGDKALYVDGSSVFGTDVGVGTATPDASAIVDLYSSTKGFLPPRMTVLERDAIVSPAEGLMIFNTDSKTFDGFDGTSWVVIGTQT